MHRAAGVLLVVFTLTACQNHIEIDGRSKSFRASALLTADRTDLKKYTKNAIHVLFIVDRDIPKGMISIGISHGGGSGTDECVLGFDYWEKESGFTVGAKLTTILKEHTVKLNGEKFQLSKGNLFLAQLDQGGSLQLTQLNRVIEDPEVKAEEVLGVMKTMLPGNARVQAVKPF